MTDEAGFLRAISAQPTDNVTRLVYADWLEERGDALSSVKAKYLRTDVHVSELDDDGLVFNRLVARLRLLATGLSADWKAAISRLPLENCQLRWAFACPKTWEQLRETADPRVRTCGACRKDVRYCDTVEEARTIALGGGCVVVDLREYRCPDDLSSHRSMVFMGAFQS